MNRLEVMHRRKSCRKYAEKEIAPELMKKVHEACHSAKRLYEGVEVDVHIIDQEQSKQILSGLIGSYGKIVAPHYLVVTAEDKEGYRENVGFTLEQVVLELASMGLGTCWIGGSFKRGAVKDVVPMKSNHVPVVLISFGHPAETNGHLRNPSDAKRLTMSEIVSGPMDETWEKIMETVRLAPSAMNSQPWRFVFEGKTIHVFAAKPKIFIMNGILDAINRIDLGIGLSHLVLSAKHYNKNVEFAMLQQEGNKEQRYVVSVVEK